MGGVTKHNHGSDNCICMQEKFVAFVLHAHVYIQLWLWQHGSWHRVLIIGYRLWKITTVEDSCTSPAFLENMVQGWCDQILEQILIPHCGYGVLFFIQQKTWALSCLQNLDFDQLRSWGKQLDDVFYGLFGATWPVYCGSYLLMGSLMSSVLKRSLLGFRRLCCGVSSGHRPFLHTERSPQVTERWEIERERAGKQRQWPRTERWSERRGRDRKGRRGGQDMTREKTGTQGGRDQRKRGGKG